MKSFKPNCWVAPQPVLIVGTYDKDGKPNAMNVAWGGQWDMKEVYISMGKHATTDNLDLKGEFTIAFATVETMVASDYVGIVSGKNEPNKVAITGWNVVKAENVDAPVFTDFPMTFECRITRKIDEDASGYHMVAEIVNILCDEKYLTADGKPDIYKMNLISYEPVGHTYAALGSEVGKAFACGKDLKK